MSDEAQNPDKPELVTMTFGFELLCSQAAIIAELPLEEWRAALDRAESIGPFIDPTLMQAYIYSEKPKILKEILDAAIPLKRAVLKARETATLHKLT